MQEDDVDSSDSDEYEQTRAEHFMYKGTTVYAKVGKNNEDMDFTNRSSKNTSKGTFKLRGRPN